MRLLIIEDDVQLGTVLSEALRQRGHIVTVASTGQDGLAAAADGHEVILADLGLPDLGGIEVIRRIRATSQVPIVVLSGRPEVEAVTKALDAGADDFVHKPFRLVDLEARLRAALRRPTLATPQHSVSVGDLRIDLDRRVVEGPQGQVRLTPTEWKVLTALATCQGRAITHLALGRAVWGDTAFVQARESLRVHIASLRAKLGESCIATESGIGYRWVGDPSRPSEQQASIDDDEQQPTAGARDAAESDRVLRHDLNNAVATLTVIAGMLDPRVSLSRDARQEAQARLSTSVESLRTIASEIGRRLGGA